jgi:LysR family transcriptional regulator, hydrogen peroxide-inducible genes activator
VPTLTQLEYIIAVDKLKHFGRAAESCHVSQPSLSAQIQKVEEDLNVTIFDRSKKPIVTTDLGLKVIEQAKKVLLEHHRLMNLQLNTDKVQGRFHLAVIPTLSAYIVPLFVESFSKKFPEVELTISENKTSEILELLHEDKIDAGLLVTPIDDSTIEEKFLFYEPFFAFVADSHSFYKKSSLVESDLEGETLWLLNEGHCFRNQVLEICGFKNKNQVLNNVTFESGSLETLKNLIRQGQGYTLLPHLATLNLSKEEKAKNLKSFKKPIPTRQVSLIYTRKFNKEKIIDSLATEIISKIPEDLRKIKKTNLDVIPI